MTMNSGSEGSVRGLPRWTAVIPVALLLAVAGFFGFGLTRDPSELPTMMIDRPMPEFSLQPLDETTPLLTTERLKGAVSLINIFGSWCVSCAVEHPFLMELSRKGLVNLHGVDWREEAAEGKAWLDRHGNPYQSVGVDADSRLAIDLGVTGAPETFVVDRDGRVRFKQVGPITPEVWKDTLQPLIRELEAQK